MFDGIGSEGEVYGIGSPNDVRYGIGAAGDLEGFVTERDLESVVVVTDSDIVDAGATDSVFGALSGVDVSTFDGVTPEPKLEVAERAADAVRAADADLVVGVGGGSCLDTAKLAAVLAAHDVPVRDMLGMGNVPAAGLPTVLLPTTAGTGSEVTHIGVFSDGQDGNKKVVYSEHLFCDLALVDPALTASLPPAVAAATGMDALSHAIEAYVSTKRTPFTDTLARRAIELIGDNLRQAVHQGPQNDDARYRMSLAAMLGGQAFVNSGLGAVHALTYPLGVEYGIGHGRANAVLLPHVVAFNAPAEPERLADVGRLLGLRNRPDDSPLEAARRTSDAIAELNADIGIPNHISELGDIDEDEFSSFADVAFEHSKHNIDRNPRTMTRDDVIDVFEMAY